jgi:hypothetical protein
MHQGVGGTTMIKLLTQTSDVRFKFKLSESDSSRPSYQSPVDSDKVIMVAESFRKYSIYLKIEFPCQVLALSPDCDSDIHHLQSMRQLCERNHQFVRRMLACNRIRLIWTRRNSFSFGLGLQFCDPIIHLCFKPLHLRNALL